MDVPLLAMVNTRGLTFLKSVMALCQPENGNNNDIKTLVSRGYHPVGIGQGYWTATPIQMSKALMTLINDGQVKTPHLLLWHQVR